MFYSVQARKWLWLKLVGGTLLTAAFFLPTLEFAGCTVTTDELFESWIPSSDIFEFHDDTPSLWVDTGYIVVERLTRILFYFSPYAFGLSIALGILCQLAGLPRSASFLGYHLNRFRNSSAICNENSSRMLK